MYYYKYTRDCCTLNAYGREQSRRGQLHQRRRLGEVVGCIVENGNSRYTKSTVQLANFPGRRRHNVSSSDGNFRITLIVSIAEKNSQTSLIACVLSGIIFVREETKKICHH